MVDRQAAALVYSVVYHDVSRIGEEIEKKGMRKIANSLTDFFTEAIVSVPPYWINAASASLFSTADIR